MMFSQFQINSSFLFIKMLFFRVLFHTILHDEILYLVIADLESGYVAPYNFLTEVGLDLASDKLYLEHRIFHWRNLKYPL